jgi:hypothetical protein
MYLLKDKSQLPIVEAPVFGSVLRFNSDQNN